MKRALAHWTAAGCVAASLALAPAPGAGAATLDFTGTLQVLIADMRDVGGNPASLTAAGGGSALVNGSGGGIHLNSLALAGGSFGPTTVTFPGSSLTNVTGISSLRLTLAGNLTGSFSGISGGPPGGGPMGVAGIAKICLIFGGPGCIAAVPLPSHTDWRRSRLRHRRNADYDWRREYHPSERPVDHRPAGDDDPHPEQHDLDTDAAGGLRPWPGLAHLEYRAALRRRAAGDGEQGLHEPYGRVP